MNVRRNVILLTLSALAAAIVFSPLIASLSTASFEVTEVFRRLRGPLVPSMTVALIAAITAVVIGLPFALVVDRSRSVIRRVCWSLAILTLIVPPYIVAESTIVLLGPAGKISRSISFRLGLGPSASDPLGRARFAVPGFVFSSIAAGIVIGGCFFPIVALAVASINRRIDRRIFESIRLMRGRGGIAMASARLIFPAALGSGLLVFALALNESVVPQLLRVRTIGEAMFESIQGGNLPVAAGMSLALLPLIISTGAIGVFLLVRTRTASAAGMEGEVPKFSYEGSCLLADLSAIATTAIATVPGLAVPAVGLGWLMWEARLPAPTGGAYRVLRASGFIDSLRGAIGIAQNDAVRTVFLASVTATLALMLAVSLVRAFASSRSKIALGGLGAGLAVPPPIVGLGLIVLWDRGLATMVFQSSVIVVLAWLARFLPVAVLLTQSALARVPRDLEQAAALAGRGPLNRLATVTLPTAAPGLIAAWLSVYVLSSTEYVATLLISPPGAPLLAPSVVNLMRRGQDPEIAACQVLLLSVVATPLLVLGGISLILRSRRKRGS